MDCPSDASQSLSLSNESQRPRERGEGSENDKLVWNYLLVADRCDVFKELYFLREKISKDPAVDSYYKAEKHQRGSEEYKKRLDAKMLRIARGLKKTLGGDFPSQRLLDICFAPGGFSRAFLENDDSNRSFGISLPEEEDGLEIRLVNEHFKPKYMDITLLADEFGQDASRLKEIDPHGRAWNADRPFMNEPDFQFVICDGHLERLEEGESEDDHLLKIQRLILSQLILALQRLSDGGVLVIRLYNPDAWQSVSIIHQFSKFSDVELFRSEKDFQRSSVFYMIAKNVRKHDPMAVESLRGWRDDWYRTMLGGANQSGEMLVSSGAKVEEVMAEFGETLIKIGKRCWEIQMGGLEWLEKKVKALQAEKIQEKPRTENEIRMEGSSWRKGA